MQQPRTIQTTSSFRSAEEKKQQDEETSFLLSYYQKNYGGRHHSSLPTTTEIPRRQRRHSTIFVGIVLCLLVIVITLKYWQLQRNVDVYDYIVVGAGPAGIIVATRLAEQFPKLRVLLIEAGRASQSSVRNESINGYDIPLFWSGMASSSDSHHWNVPRTILGKGLGGSGLLNAMIYMRSLESDWKNISGWEYETILKEYESLESFRPHLVKKSFANLSETVHRGHHGPIVTSQPTVLDELARYFLESAALTNLTQTSSFNEGRRTNVTGLYEFNIVNGIRDSVARAFLTRPPSNLVVKTDSVVTRVLLEHTTNTAKSTWAVGVEYVYNSQLSQSLLRNKRGEVILSAGAILTPQLLWNSGVDNKHIGSNLQDHPVVCIGFQLSHDIALSAKSIYDVGLEMQDYKSAVRNLQRTNVTKDTFLLEKVGILGTAGFSAGAFLQSPWANDSAPDIQLTVFPRHMEPHVTNTNRIVPNAMLVTVALLDAEARFQVYSNQSSARLVHSVVDDDVNATRRVLGYRLPTVELPRDRREYLSAKDVQRLAWGVEQVRNIQSKAPLSNHTGPEIYPSVRGGHLNEYIAANVLKNSHFAGSTAIGSVVDERLRVLGVDGLRIVDAGVLPKVPNGNIHSTICVIASRAAGMVAEDRGAH